MEEVDVDRTGVRVLGHDKLRYLRIVARRGIESCEVSDPGSSATPTDRFCVQRVFIRGESHARCGRPILELSLECRRPASLVVRRAVSKGDAIEFTGAPEGCCKTVVAPRLLRTFARASAQDMLRILRR